METVVDLSGMVLGEEIHPELGRTILWVEDEGQHCLSAAPLGVVRCDQVPHSGCAPGCGQRNPFRAARKVTSTENLILVILAVSPILRILFKCSR